jgi:hypothetical protein
VRTVPDTFEVVVDFRGPVRFEFDERISERVAGGALDAAVIISPKTGDVRVGHGRRELVVDLDGGFRPGLVYRVTLLPVISDMFNNRLRDPFELVFSTGGEAVPTAIAGLVWDRLTGRGAPGYRVHALPFGPEASENEAGDSVAHVAVTDAGGVFALRYVPLGRYEVTAFDDRNRDAAPDPMEVQGSRRTAINGPDTLVLLIPVLQPDTTPASIILATPLDSITILIDFDDYLDPDFPLAGVAISLTDVNSEVVGAARVFHEHEYVEYAAAVTDSFAVLDSLDAVDAAAARAVEQAAAAADSAAVTEPTAAADTALIVDPGATPAVERQARRQGPIGLDGRPTPRPTAAVAERTRASERTGPSGERLPSQRIVALFTEPLIPNEAYQLRVTSVRNIFSIPLGGGEAAVVLEPPPVEDTTSAADTTAVTDTTIVPDTGTVAGTASWMSRRR